jgi:hypothetical protein
LDPMAPAPPVFKSARNRCRRTVGVAVMPSEFTALSWPYTVSIFSVICRKNSRDHSSSDDLSRT